MVSGTEPEEATDGASPAERLRRSELTDDLSFLLARANALSLAAANAVLARHGLRVRSYSVLALAVDDTRPSQRDLAAFLSLDPSQVVALVDDLQGRGLVRRETDPADRRSNVVVATSEGRDVLVAARRDAANAERELHRRVTNDERDALVKLLRLLAFPN
ncbi:MAG TPA: MarR family winged helix-turn-helix transcriptional regulator [Microbacterium sp.]|nr:MarR family winged helix-turn-helix transcriptional regulator [Microbacterium sp.]